MDKPNSQPEKPKEKRRYDPELLRKGLRCDLDQYGFLKQCSAKGKEGVKEWNQWRKEHHDEDVLLEGAELVGAYLEGAKLKNAVLWEAKLQKANLRETYLQGAILRRAHLQGAEFGRAKLQGADFSRAIVDGETLIWRCKVDRKTKFEGVVLDAARIYPATRQLLEYNVRRMNWEAWYKYKNWQDNKDERHIVIQKLMWFIRLFWSISDYGKSTGRIVATFFILALFFAVVYANCAYWWPPGIVSDLIVEPHLPIWHYFLLLLLRPIYFSVVTMTTLGFGDMYANSQSIWGHILLTFQVILGYVLLGALVTRFAVLFTAGGPAGEFADEKEKKDKTQ